MKLHAYAALPGIAARVKQKKEKTAGVMQVSASVPTFRTDLLLNWIPGMRERKDELMEFVYESTPNILSVKWSDELSVESSRFFQTIVSLFAIIQEKNVANLIIDSGIPAGGVLTEEVIHYFIQHIPGTPLKNIAILESPDYLWDNNLYQVIKLLIASHRLPVAVDLVKDKAAAREFFSPSLFIEKPKPKER
ncbi:hypothetical protein OB13_04360 [Pontibacter sp. HJ8]